VPPKPATRGPHSVYNTELRIQNDALGCRPGAETGRPEADTFQGFDPKSVTIFQTLTADITHIALIQLTK